MGNQRNNGAVTEAEDKRLLGNYERALLDKDEAAAHEALKAYHLAMGVEPIPSACRWEKLR